MVLAPYIAYSIYGPCYKRGSEAQDWAVTSHLYHRIKAITSVRTYRTSWSITRSFPCPSGSDQPSSNRLAPPERPTTSNLAPYHWVWPATDQPWPQLGVALHTRSFQMAFSCGDGYAHRWACHLMMMMMYSTRITVVWFWVWPVRWPEDRELNHARSKPDRVDRPVRTARSFVHYYNGTQYSSTYSSVNIPLHPRY